jgi:putative FmdB family regulatory protein
MPIYEYRCECGAVNEFLVGVNADPVPGQLLCERCGSGHLERLLSRINIGSSLKQMIPSCGGGDCPLPKAARGGCCGGSCHGH